MKLVLYLSALVMVVVCATWAYRVNYATQEAMNRVADLRDEIAAEREAIAILNAEWAYLNRPDRLAQLVQANAAALGLVELGPDQFGEVASAPFPPDPEGELAAMVAGVVAAQPATRATAPAATGTAATRTAATRTAATRTAATRTAARYPMSGTTRAAVRMPLARPLGATQ